MEKIKTLSIGKIKMRLKKSALKIRALSREKERYEKDKGPLLPRIEQGQCGPGRLSRTRRVERLIGK